MKPTHLLAATLLTALILACLAAPAAAFSGAGSGTEADPYIITTPAELQSMQDDLSAYYQLGNDIDLSSLGSSSSANALIGSATAPFTGTLDGNGYTVSNINRVVLWIFGATIKNIKITDISVTVTSNDYYGFKGNGFIRTGKLYNDGNSANTFSQVAVENIQLSITTNGVSGSGRLVNCQPSGIGAGLGDTVLNCYVLGGSITGTRTAAYNGVNVGGIGISSSVYDSYVKLNYLSASKGSSANAYIGGIVGQGRYFSDVYLDSVVSLTPEYKGSPTSYGRLNTPATDDAIITNSYGINPTIVGSASITSGTLTDDNGANVDAATAATQTFYEDTLGWDFDTIWYWDDVDKLPKLQVFRASVPPTISAISATPATGGQLTEYTLSATATTEAAGGIASYQWSYSTDSGQTWQPISGATAATYVWQPGTSISGSVLLKCYITGADGGTVDSYDAGYTNIQITVYPPPDISTISVSRPLQKVNTPTTLTATLAESEPATYQWYYSTNGGTTWTPISGATAITAEYTPTTTGTHSVKIVVTNSFGESNELTTNFNVLPTYTPTPIINRSVDISIDSTAKYQGIQQFTLSAELKAINYYTPNIAHLAHDNALYYLDSAEREVIPVSTTTGGTISAAYVGQNTGIITDTSGNTAFYSYQTNDWQYVEQNSAAIIASTSSYAATVSGGTLRIYNLNGNLVASTATTAANLAGNDQTNVFVSYNDKTLTYYWVNGNSISSASQTITHSITELHQISGTNNFIISTTANTIIVEITDAGVYSLVATSETDTPLIHTQATSINIFIGVSSPNEIFIIGADGETDGTYVTGSTLSDASIAKATGLYAIAGGADYQAYILSKSDSSVWQLQQVVNFGGAIDYSQISTTGTYAAVATGLKLYLLEAKDTDSSTYYLQGVVIDSSGKPYAGKSISINGDSIRTDTKGMFLYPVQPGNLVIITAGDTTVEYTPSSAALQQIAIRIKAGLLSTDVTYSADYNAESQAIIMSYDDAAGKTTTVNWKIYETTNNTLVATYTGNTASYPIEAGDVYNNYYVQLSADRGGATVTNTWSITPAGGQPIDLYGLDEDGRNIIFGFLLLLLAGLFGVMHSRSGAIIVALGACVMRYLELITIPWILITIAAVLAIVAAIAHGGQNR